MTHPRARFVRFFAAMLFTATLAFAAPPADFTVESPTDGSKFRLSDAKGHYVALHFLLKTECPFCLRHTRDYANKSASLPGVVQVFLKPDSAEEIKGWTAKLGEEAGKHVVIYRYADAALAKAYGIPEGYRFHGQVVRFPALVLLDSKGGEVFRHVGKNNTDRLSFEQLAAKIAELEKAGNGAPKPATKTQ